MITSIRGRDWQGVPVAVTVADGHVRAVARIDDAQVPNVTLLPGLHDHHVHLFAAGMRAASIDVSGCRDVADLRIALADAPGTGPMRVVGYDDTRIGPLDRGMLDAATPDGRAVRVQHRGGHLWVLNSSACEAVRRSGVTDIPADGRFWDRDGDLAHSAAPLPDDALIRVVERLSARGVVAVDDLTPTLDTDGIAMLRRGVGDTLTVRVFGSPAGSRAEGVKLLLSDHALPSPDALVTMIEAVRPASVALHCVSVDALAIVLASAHALRAGDRLEHAFVTPRGLAEAVLALAPISVGVHPGFLRTHGDRHARFGDEDDVRDYLRMRSWRDAGAVLLGGTDRPFSRDDPWTAMQAAVDRRTETGLVLGTDEALTPEEAFTLFRADGLDGRGARLGLHPGDAADVCVIAGSWQQARRDLGAVTVQATVRAGRLTHGMI